MTDNDHLSDSAAAVLRRLLPPGRSCEPRCVLEQVATDVDAMLRACGVVTR